MNRNTTHSALKFLFGSAIMLFFHQFAFGQLQATGGNTAPFTPQNLISNIFLGEGVEVTSITYGGDPAAVGYFTGGQSVIGIDRGIILTSGRAASNGTTYGCDEQGSDFASSDATGSATSPTLTALVPGGTLNDISIYTIKFIPTSSQLQFRYCFASEEYPEYACSQYNDVFGFFISGPGLPNDTNIAKIPNTNLPVTINNIHPNNSTPFNPCPAYNAQYYNANTGTNNQPTYDGFTDVFFARATVIPCQEYTIKLAIADVGDSAYDSGVFLEAKSFGTGSMRVEYTTVSNDGTVTEGCSPGTLTFKVPLPVTQNLPIDYNIWGSAINGLDFQFIDTTLFIPAGQTQVSVPIIGLEDNIAEGNEFIAIDVQRDPCNRDTIYLFVRENSMKPPVLRPDTTVCIGAAPLELNGALPIALPLPSTFVNLQPFTLSPPFTPIISPISVFGVQPTVLSVDMIKSVCIDITHPFDDDLDIYLISPAGKFIELTTDNGGAGDNYTTTCFTPVATTPINFPGPQAPASATPFTGEFKPEGLWTDLANNSDPANGTWKLQVTDDSAGFPPPGTGQINNWSITFEPAYRVDYLWSPTAGLSCPTCPVTDAAPTQTTSYVLTAIDNYGCTEKDTIHLDVRDALPAPTITCGNSTSSSVTFEWLPIQDAQGYEISINGGPWTGIQNNTSYTEAGLSPSSVVGAEIRGINSILICSANIGSSTCVNCVPPGVIANPVAAKCNNSTDGGVTLVPDGLNPPYTFRVSTASNTTGVFTGLAGGNYIGTITDGSGCDTLLNFTIPAPPALIPNITVQQNVSCFGGSDGALNLLVTGGAGPYITVWSNPADPTSSANLPAGTYSATITDANNCTVTAPGTITQPLDLQVTASGTDASCFGTATGSLLAAPAGGVSPYIFEWSGSIVGSPITGVLAGTYTVTVTDDKGCTEVAQTTINEPDLLTASTATTATKCSTSTDGTATALPAGGTVPYTYLWNNATNQTTQTATNLAVQLYTVTITDSKGCSTIATAIPASPPALTATLTQTATSCNGGTNGSASVTTNGGNGGYTYIWNNTGTPQTTSTATGLPPGNIAVTVTDLKGCTTSGVISVTEPSVMLLSGAATPAKCFGAQDGTAKVVANGATPPYSYTWTSGDNTANIDFEPAGIYTVTVTDANNCTSTLSQTITQPTAISMASTPDPVECYGTSTGAIATSFSGGAGGYTLFWNGPNNYISTDPNPVFLFAGAYKATVTDASGCTIEQTVSINQPAAPLHLTTPFISDTICFESTNGIARVNAAGGTTPYIYQWDDPNAQTTASAVDVGVALYHITVTDANGCTANDSTYVTQKGQLFAYVEGQLPDCNNGTDGEAIVAFISYGSEEAPSNLFEFEWSTNPPQYGTQATGLRANQTYFVVLTDSDGCTATQTVTIGNPPVLAAQIDNIIDVLCFGDATGQGRAVGEGGTAPYTYLWSPNVSDQTNSWAENLAADTYRVTVTDDNGCFAIQNLSIGQPDPIENQYTIRHIACFGENTGSATILTSGGTSPYTFQWANGATNATVNDLAAGTTALTVTDNNNCKLIDSVAIRQPDTPLAGVLAKTDVNCYGDNDGQIEITGSGGTPPYKFALNDGNFNGSPLQIGLKAGVYTPKIQDANGCILTLDALILSQRSAVQVELGPDITIELGQSAQLLAEITGSVNPVRIQWDNADSTWLSCLDCIDPFVDSLFFQQTFDIYVVDATGCPAEDRITVVVEKPRRIYVPTGFTPNDDNTNDQLLVHGQESAKILEFRVYDRWGEQLYKAEQFTPNDITVGWDGTFRGKPMDPGAYIWTLEVEYMDGAREIMKGYSMLIR